jgi:hypothetical protein
VVLEEGAEQFHQFSNHLTEEQVEAHFSQVLEPQQVD